MKAMASDFDGTLFFMFDEEPLRQKDLNAIEIFQKNGGLFGICTGRSQKGITDFVPEGLFDFYILVSGALILDRNQQVISKTCIPFSVMKEIHENYKNQVKLIIQANDNVYNTQNQLPYQIYLEEIDDLKDGDIYGLSFGTKSKEDAKVIAKEINDAYGDILIAFANVKNVDIVSKDCSKGNALKMIREYLAIDCMAGIGDSHNDIPMLEDADYAYTFAYAPEQAQEVADAIVGSVAEALQIFQMI